MPAAITMALTTEEMATTAPIEQVEAAGRHHQHLGKRGDREEGEVAAEVDQVRAG